MIRRVVEKRKMEGQKKENIRGVRFLRQKYRGVRSTVGFNLIRDILSIASVCHQNTLAVVVVVVVVIIIVESVAYRTLLATKHDEEEDEEEEEEEEEKRKRGEKKEEEDEEKEDDGGWRMFIEL
ncbi:hypothetical protein M0802_004695 [Mischocyttarus mexicanus]|nr:hypothetical protein M0802_004695 [Mischocyttarus mexicanus]